MKEYCNDKFIPNWAIEHFFGKINIEERAEREVAIDIVKSMSRDDLIKLFNISKHRIKLCDDEGILVKANLVLKNINLPALP